MAGRFDRVGGVWDKVNKRYDKVGGIWQPVKKRYDKTAGVWQQSFSGAQATARIVVNECINSDTRTKINEDGSGELNMNTGLQSNSEGDIVFELIPSEPFAWTYSVGSYGCYIPLNLIYTQHVLTMSLRLYINDSLVSSYVLTDDQSVPTGLWIRKLSGPDETFTVSKIKIKVYWSCSTDPYTIYQASWSTGSLQICEKTFTQLEII